MKRRWLFLLAIALVGLLPLSAWADVTLVTTADGTQFKFGMYEKLQIFTTRNTDFVNNFNFRSFTSPDTALGNNDLGLQNFANLTFTLEKGPLRVYGNLEQETGIDAAVVDANNPNLERFALYYKFEQFGTMAAGFDVHAFDPEGALIYTDEHPGVWLVGGDDNLSWDVAWHRVLDCSRGGNLFGRSGAAGCQNSTLDSDQISDLFMGRVNVKVLPTTTVSPLFVFYRRHVPQNNINEFSAPTGGALLTAATTGANDSFSNQYRPGIVVRHTTSPITITGEAVGLLGKINDVPSTFLGPVTTAATRDYDLRSFALFLEIALDGNAIGMPGWTPYVSFEWHRGDSDPFDDTYAGYVPVSNLSAALRKDGFKGQSISAYGPPTLGANAEDGWGFDVTARGTGATLGTIVPDETLGGIGGDATHFNNRGGKATNPGFKKASVGLLGKVNPNVDTHLGLSAFWYDKSEPIEAEAAQNCMARATFGCAGGAGAVGNPTAVQAAQAALKTAGVDLDKKFMGVEFNANVGWNMNNLRVQPFISVFFPGDIAEEISTAFLSTAGNPLSKETAFTGGVEISARF